MLNSLLNSIAWRLGLAEAAARRAHRSKPSTVTRAGGRLHLQRRERRQGYRLHRRQPGKDRQRRRGRRRASGTGSLVQRQQYKRLQSAALDFRRLFPGCGDSVEHSAAQAHLRPMGKRAVKSAGFLRRTPRAAVILFNTCTLGAQQGEGACLQQARCNPSPWCGPAPPSSIGRTAFMVEPMAVSETPSIRRLAKSAPTTDRRACRSWVTSPASMFTPVPYLRRRWPSYTPIRTASSRPNGRSPSPPRPVRSWIVRWLPIHRSWEQSHETIGKHRRRPDPHFSVFDQRRRRGRHRANHGGHGQRL